MVVLGAGSWGKVLANLLSFERREKVFVWVRDEMKVRELSSLIKKDFVWGDIGFNENVKFFSDLNFVSQIRPKVMVWALPSSAVPVVSNELKRVLLGSEILIHASKGLADEKKLLTVSQGLLEKLPIRKIGVLSGPNLAHEVQRGDLSATVIASSFEEVSGLGKKIFETPFFKVEPSGGMIGVEWCGILKNLLAIASGYLQAKGMGWNSRAYLLAEGVKEMMRFSEDLGVEPNVFYGLAGVGDLWATCSSEKSRNYQVGFLIGQGLTPKAACEKVGHVAEGVRTAVLLRNLFLKKNCSLFGSISDLVEGKGGLIAL